MVSLLILGISIQVALRIELSISTQKSEDIHIYIAEFTI